MMMDAIIPVLLFDDVAELKVTGANLKPYVNTISRWTFISTYATLTRALNDLRGKSKETYIPLMGKRLRCQW
jgi:hypothetical protein